MLAKPPLKHGSLGDAPLRTRGGGDAHPHAGKQEPCIYFLKRGRCFRGDRCHFRHVQPPNKPSPVPQYKKHYQGKRDTFHKTKADNSAKICFYCGKKGHRKKECRKRGRDTAKTVTDFVCPAVEAALQPVHSDHGVGSEPQVSGGSGEAAFHADDNLTNVEWLVDGGASCHVLGFDPGSRLRNRRQVSIEIEVGGGHRISCTCTGDMTILTCSQAPTSSVDLRDVRIVPGFGSNLLSGPRMVKAGWSLTQQDGIFTALDGRRHVVFSILADPRGLYYLSSTVISRITSITSSQFRGQRNAQLQHGAPQKRTASHFFGPDGENVQVKVLHADVACRLGQREVTTGVARLFVFHHAHTRVRAVLSSI